MKKSIRKSKPKKIDNSFIKLIKPYKHVKSNVEGGIVKPKPGIYKGVTNKMYHTWPEFHALSAGGLKPIINQSPLHFVTSQQNNKTSEAMNFGSAAHSFIMEPELDEVMVLDKISASIRNKAEKFREFADNHVILPETINLRTNLGKKQYADFCEEHKGKMILKQKEFDEYMDAFKQYCEYLDHKESNIIVTAEEMERLQQMRDVFHSKKSAMSLLSGSIKELTVIWNDPEYEFICKCRPDMTFYNFLGLQNIMVDYKTTGNASMEEFAKTFINYHYHSQAYWYRKGMEKLTGMEWGYIFIAQETKPPFELQCFEIPEVAFRKAKKDVEIACNVYNECLKSKYWHGYTDDYVTLQLPKWFTRDLI